MMNAFVGTGPLVRLILRRDRVILPIWILVLPLLALALATSYAQLYPTVALREAFAHDVAGNPAEVALLGPVFIPNIAGLTAWRWSMAAAVIIGIASMLTVIRHTRTEEETGRRELLSSSIVGRNAALTAALIVTFSANVLMAILTAAGLISLGLPVAGSIALGLSAAAVGWTFTALAGIAAQLTQSAGAAKGLVGVFIGLFYLLRAFGDSGLPWLTWLSPLGWMRSVRPFADERWWIFALFLVLVALLTGAAYMLSTQRDLGASLLQPRPGPAVASPGLNNPFALAWRLQRGMLLSWIVSFIILGAAFGYIAQTAARQLPASFQVSSLFASSKTSFSDVFFTLALLIFVEALSAYVILATLQLRSEEVAMRVDPILATAVGRVRWAISHFIFAILGSALILTAFSLTAGLMYGLSIGKVGYELPRILIASLAYLPSIWVLAGSTLIFFGLLPRFSVFASWTLLAILILIDLAGELHQVNQTIQNISPFAHVPKLLLVSGASVVPLIGLLLVAILFSVIGLIGFQRREIG
jgi:ABC-2 type transport system permease protein